MFFWNSLAFSMIQRMLAIWSLVPLPFLKPAWTSGSSRFMYCWLILCSEGKMSATCSLFPLAAWGPLAFLPVTLSASKSFYQVIAWKRKCWVRGPGIQNSSPRNSPMLTLGTCVYVRLQAAGIWTVGQLTEPGDSAGLTRWDQSN